MKTKIQLTALLMSLSLIGTAQTTLFQENFETSPVTSILNIPNSETQLTSGPSPCGLASRGNTSDFNSTNVDFKNAQNSSYFLGVNPESPCGGFYNASLSTSSLDFSSATDSIIFKCRYFKSSTLSWGTAQLDIVFDNGSLSDTISSEFVTTDNWDNLEVRLPSFVISPSVTITINIGGGEGVAIDDIEVLGYNGITTGISELSVNSISIYPNPVENFIFIKNESKEEIEHIKIYSLSGQIVINEKLINNQNSIDVSDLIQGVYIIYFSLNDGSTEVEKFVKE